MIWKEVRDRNMGDRRVGISFQRSAFVFIVTVNYKVALCPLG